MSVVGIDLGNQYLKLAGLKNGSVDTLLFNQSSRKSPGILCFLDKRFVGLEAQSLVKSNLDCSINNLKKKIFNFYNEINSNDNIFLSIIKDKNRPYIQIKDNKYLLHQLFSFIIKKSLMSTIQRIPDTLVVSIPSFFNFKETQFIKQSLNLIKINNVHVVSEEIACSLDYGYYRAIKQEFENQSNVLFINIGNSNVQVFITEFTNEKCNIVKSSYSNNIGGNSFDLEIYNIMKLKIMNQYNIDIEKHPKKKLFLLNECEKAKKTLSANNKTNIILEYLTDDDRIFKEEITRDYFNEKTKKHVNKIITLIDDCLKDYDIKNIHKIELLGGSMRIPSIKKSIENKLKLDLSYSLNADESISKGSVIYGALHSYLVKIKDYHIENIIQDNIYVDFDGKKVQILNKNTVLPVKKIIKITLKNNYGKFQKNANIIINNNTISNYIIINEDDDNKMNKLEISIKVDVNRIVDISSCILVEKDKQVKLNFFENTILNEEEIKKIEEIEFSLQNNEDIIDKTNNLKNLIEEKFYDISSELYDAEFNKYMSEEETTKLKEILLEIDDIVSEDPDTGKVNIYHNLIESLDFYKKEVNFRRSEYQLLPKIMNETKNNMDSLISKIEENEESITKINEIKKWYNNILEIYNKSNLYDTPNITSNKFKSDYNKLESQLKSLIPQVTAKGEK
jgi:molecular chaperone DnaK (HSP70)